MTDIASLGLSVSSDGVVVATDRLKDLEKASGGAEKGADNLQGAMKRLSSVAGTVAGAIAAAFSVRAISQYADAWSDMQSRIGAAIKSMDDAPRVMRRMVDLANASYSSLDQTVAVYARNAGVLRDLGLSADQAADYTESLNHMLVITATRGERAASVQDALSKAMAVGKLQADGLETILAHGGRVAEALAKELGGSGVNSLRAFASEGKITSGVIASALLKSLTDVRTEAAEMPATIGDGFTRIQTGVMALVGAFDQMSSGSGTVASLLLSVGDALLWLADHAQDAQGYLIAAAISLTAYFAPAIWGAVTATAAFVAGLITLRGALLASGIGAFIVFGGLLLNKILDIVRAVGSWGQAFKLLGEVVSGVWEGIVGGAQAIPAGLEGVWQKIREAFYALLSDLMKAWSDFLGSLSAAAESAGLGTLSGKFMGGQGAALSTSNDLLMDSINAGAAAEAAFARAGEAATAGFTKANDALGLLKQTVTSTAEAVDGAGGGEIPEIPGGGGGGGGGGKGGKSLRDAFTELQGSLAVDLSKAQQSYADNLSILRQAYDAELITRGEYQAMIEGMEVAHTARLQQINQDARAFEVQAQNQMYSSLAGMLSAFGQQSKGAAMAALALNTWLRVREVLQNSMAAAWHAYATLGPIAGAPVAAKMIAMGKVSAAFVAAQGVAQAASSGGGGSAGGSSVASTGSAASGTAAAEAKPQDVILDFSATADPAMRALAQALMPGIVAGLQKVSKTGVNIIAVR